MSDDGVFRVEQPVSGAAYRLTGETPFGTLELPQVSLAQIELDDGQIRVRSASGDSSSIQYHQLRRIQLSDVELELPETLIRVSEHNAETAAAGRESVLEVQIPDDFPAVVDTEDVLVRDVPAGGVLNHGTAIGDGAWLVPPHHVRDLTLRLPAHAAAPVKMKLDVAGSMMSVLTVPASDAADRQR